MANFYVFVAMVPALTAQLRVAYERCRHALSLRDASFRAGRA
ncbi:MAG TPA: hypothetical protein VMH36_08855 [Alphaproteobacteria bacterium]|nr:hypothetical protein [Alphaproteobacteria bacterium]